MIVTGNTGESIRCVIAMPSSGTWIIEREKIKLKNGILITGLPGIGLVGQVVGRYMVEQDLYLASLL